MHILLQSNGHNLYPTRDAAEKIAATNQADADGWTYRVAEVPAGTGRFAGYFYVEVVDEDGEVVGKL